MSLEVKSWPEFVGQDANDIVERLKAQGLFDGDDENLRFRSLERIFLVQVTIRK